MADVLKATLWYNANPPAGTVVDISGSGSATENRLWTAAETHDALETTYEALVCSGDGVAIDANASLRQDQFLTAAVGGIKFLRVKARGRVVITGTGTPTGSGRFNVLFNNIVRATQELTATFTDYTNDFSTDPATGLAWTPGAIAAQKFGLLLAADAASTTFLGTATLRMAEFTVEVWGEDVTAAATGASSDGAAASVAQGASTALGLRDPSVVVPVATNLDSTSALITVRSANATLNDQNLTTKTTNTGTNSSGTFVRDLGGLQGAAAINGVGTITGVKIVALVRASKSDTATLGTFRFGTAMGIKTLVADPTVYDYDAGLTEVMWSRVETNLITTGAFAVAFEWGNGANSVWANFVSPTWDFRTAWVAAIGKTAQIEVAEAWVEVHGPVGSQPEVIELTQVVGDTRKQFKMGTQV